MKITVYTSLYGLCKYKIKSPVINKVRPGDEIDYICFTDNIIDSNIYRCRDQEWKELDSRRNSRWAKINSHLAFPDSDITIWHDACHQMIDVYKLIDSLNDPWEFCTFKHYRSSLEEEIKACIYYKKETPDNLYNQYYNYMAMGMPFIDLIYDCSCLVRKNSDNVSKINEFWWSEYIKYSCRDQISLPFVIWKLGYKDWKPINGNRKRNPFFILND